MNDFVIKLGQAAAHSYLEKVALDPEGLVLTRAIASLKNLGKKGGPSLERLDKVRRHEGGERAKALYTAIEGNTGRPNDYHRLLREPHGTPSASALKFPEVRMARTQRRGETATNLASRAHETMQHYANNYTARNAPAVVAAQARVKDLEAAAHMPPKRLP